MANLPEFATYEVDYFDTGEIITEYWSINGIYHRIGKPAVTFYDSNTKKELERCYKRDGLNHRDDGPALEKIDPNTDVIYLEEFYKDGLLHRADGPAKILRDRVTGVILSSEFYIGGRRMDSPSPPTGLD